jgi:hypothetical protein
MTLPFEIPSADVLFASKRKVYAHYFYALPLSIGNQPAVSDYYNLQYLTPGGENGKWTKVGGYLRSRPLPVTPGPAATYAELNMQAEVRMAIARGITGFTFDILSLADALLPAGHLQSMLAAATAVDSRFTIVPMLDMSSMTGLTVAQVVQLCQTIDANPAVAELSDGRLIIAAFNATLQPLAWWEQVITALNAANISVAFVPILLGGANDAGTLDPISFGVGAWGTAEPAPSAALQSCAAAAHKLGLSYMLPILPQQFRPKSSVFWEAGNSVTFRDSWMSAINGGTDFVQIVTWSDFSESGQIQPYTDATLALNIGTGFYDLNAYYATWFLTGVQPVITRDVLFWFYRRMQSTAAHANQNAFTVVGPAEESNIELLAFLTEPGTLLINGASLAAPAGITSFKVPTTPGFPAFALQRNGSNVFHGAGPVQIYGPAGSPAGTLDMTYWSGGLTKAGLA